MCWRAVKKLLTHSLPTHQQYQINVGYCTMITINYLSIMCGTSSSAVYSTSAAAFVRNTHLLCAPSADWCPGTCIRHQAYQSRGEWTKNEASREFSLVGVNALSHLQCFDIAGWVAGKASTYKTCVPHPISSQTGGRRKQEVTSQLKLILRRLLKQRWRWWW